MSAASVSGLVVGAVWITLLRYYPEATLVPAEGGCGVAPGGGSVVWPAIPEAEAGYLVLEQGSLELKEGP
jgi:hypothetical protein